GVATGILRDLHRPRQSFVPGRALLRHHFPEGLDRTGIGAPAGAVATALSFLLAQRAGFRTGTVPDDAHFASPQLMTVRAGGASIEPAAARPRVRLRPRSPSCWRNALVSVPGPFWLMLISPLLSS